MNATFTMKQEWLVNLQNTCGYKYDVNEAGELVTSSSNAYLSTMSKLALVCGILGLYIGQVMFRFSGSGRLTHDSYNSNGSILLQLFFSALNVCLFYCADMLAFFFEKDIIARWATTVFL